MHLKPGLLACLLLTCAASLSAQRTIHVPADQPTIQAGIDSASPGDTVLVAPGTYNENIDFKGKAITVTSSGGAATTTINGTAEAAAVTFRQGETRDSVLSDLTITGGANGGLLTTTSGGIYILHANPTIIGDVIDGAGCYGIGSIAGAPLIQQNRIAHTHVSAYTNSCGDANGAGIWINGTDNTLIPFPTSQGQTPVVTENTIEENTESSTEAGDTLGGAGINVRAGAIPLIENNTIRGNAINRAAMNGGSGGGILVFAAGAQIVNNLIYDNVAVTGGGGVDIENFGLFSSAVLLLNNTIADNATQPLTNGAITVGGEQLGFAGYFPVELMDNILSGNSSSPMMVCDELPSMTGQSAVNFINNDVFNETGPITGGFNGSSCSYQVGTLGNLSNDPLFRNQADSDYTLTLASPCVDTGAASALGQAKLDGIPFSTDLAGNPRVADATNKPTAIIDIGAYEYPGSGGISDTTETLLSSLNPSIFGQTITFTTQLSSANGIPTGDVQFTDGSTVLGTESVSSAGAAVFSTSQLAVGSHSITAVYQPTGNFPAATANLTQVVNGTAATATINLSATPNPAYQGQSVTLAASVTASQAASGPVTFYDGATSLGTGSLNASGQATLSTSTLSVGTHTLAAVYGSTGSTSAPVTLTILPSSFTIAVAPTTLTLADGQQGTAAITLTSVGNFAGPLTLSVTSIPPHTAATFDTTTASLLNGANGTAHLLIDTAAVVATNHLPFHPGSHTWPLITSALLLFPLTVARSRRLRQLFLLFAAVALTQTLTGCTELRTPYQLTGPGTYQLPITATDTAGKHHTATLTVVVTPQ